LLIYFIFFDKNVLLIIWYRLYILQNWKLFWTYLDYILYIVSSLYPTHYNICSMVNRAEILLTSYIQLAIFFSWLIYMCRQFCTIWNDTIFMHYFVGHIPWPTDQKNSQECVEFLLCQKWTLYIYIEVNYLYTSLE
jgi:hypothetical protein